MALREEFTSAGKTGHRSDHLTLHRTYNAADSSLVLTNCRVVSALLDPYTGLTPTVTGVLHWRGGA